MGRDDALPDGGPVRAAKGLSLVPLVSTADAPPLDVLVHPGGQGTRQLLKDEEHFDWVRAERAHRLERVQGS